MPSVIPPLTSPAHPALHGALPTAHTAANDAASLASGAAAEPPQHQWPSHHSVTSESPHIPAPAEDAPDPAAAAATTAGAATGPVQCRAGTVAAPTVALVVANVHGGSPPIPTYSPAQCCGLGQVDRACRGPGDLAGSSPPGGVSGVSGSTPPATATSTTSTSPSPAAALLAATLVRARAAHFERLRGVTVTQLPGLGGGLPGACPGTAPARGLAAAAPIAGSSFAAGGGSGVGVGVFAMDMELDLARDEAPPTPRHSTAAARAGKAKAAAALAPLPLHPLAPHPLASAAAAGGSGAAAGLGAGAGGGSMCLSHSLSRCGSGSSLQSSLSGAGLCGSGGSWQEDEFNALAATLGGGTASSCKDGDGGGGGFSGQPPFDCYSRYGDDAGDYTTDGEEEEESIFDRPSWAFGVLGAAKPPAVAAPGGGAGAAASGWGGLVSGLRQGWRRSGHGKAGAGAAAGSAGSSSGCGPGAHPVFRPKRRWCFGFMFPRRQRPAKHNPALSGPLPGATATAAAPTAHAAVGVGAGAGVRGWQPGRPWYAGGRPSLGIALSRTSSGSALCAAADSGAGPDGGCQAGTSAAGGSGAQPGCSNPATGLGPHAFPRFGGGGIVRSLTQRFGRAASGSFTIGGVQYTPGATAAGAGAGRAKSFSGGGEPRPGPAGSGSISSGCYGPGAAGPSGRPYGAAGTATGAALDALFDDLVGHVGQLLGSHPHVAAHMGAVEGLSDRLLQLHGLCEALERKVGGRVGEEGGGGGVGARRGEEPKEGRIGRCGGAALGRPCHEMWPQPIHIGPKPQAPELPA